MSQMIDKYLVATGLKFSETKEDLDLFNNSFSNYEFELDEHSINPESILKSLKKTEVKKSGGEYFKRSVLAAKIVHECFPEPTFGRVKFQKLVYLCEHVSQMNIHANYSQMAAGPMDTKFMHSIKPTFQKQGWFKIEKEPGKFGKNNFVPLDNVDGYKKYFLSYYNEYLSDIEFLITKFKRAKTDDVELVATIFYSWDKINKEKCIFSIPLLIQAVYDFHESKAKFSESQISNAFEWMKENGVYPSE